MRSQEQNRKTAIFADEAIDVHELDSLQPEIVGEVVEEDFTSDRDRYLRTLADFQNYRRRMMKAGTGEPDKTSAFRKAAEQSFGSYDIWRADFVGIGKMRGVGWAICYQDPTNGQLSNHWISLHQIGNVAGFTPALVMDVWEHAFLLDYKPAERPKYIEAFFSNIDWSAVDKRLQKSTAAARG